MQEKLIRVAVYGTLMRGERNEHWGADARSRVPCTIRGVLYDTGWGYPAFVPDGRGVVKAEFIVLPVVDWPAIDRLEGFRPGGHSMYQRVMVAVLCGRTSIPAWTYWMPCPPYAERVASGQWLRT